MTETTTFYTVKISTTNDVNGNPRRGWLVYDAEGLLKGFADDGYRGLTALKVVAATLAGRDTTHGTAPTGAEYVNDAIECTGPNGTVRIVTTATLTVPVKEYRNYRNAPESWLTQF